MSEFLIKKLQLQELAYSNGVPGARGGQYFLMHDGRAKSIEEAILLHGGEAENSKNQYLQLNKQEQSNLIGGKGGGDRCRPVYHDRASVDCQRRLAGREPVRGWQVARDWDESVATPSHGR